ncbi:MAG: hypothetical protein BWY74_00707 [Firmicutes bacterium ADurb.Bin419]|nr:MAG: hypothetical protein BWY74_00707 [Firmicutes bacterium ADurb.Bin419]
MKNQYFADVGDFGKYGMLSCLSGIPFNMGINWYLTENDTKTDGKFVDYLNKSDFLACDRELHDFLYDCIVQGRRNVNELSRFPKYIDTIMYDKVLNVEHIKALSPEGRDRRRKVRKEWFQNSMDALEQCNLIFCDPDNGIETRSLSHIGKDSVKYVFIDEIREMLDHGKSVICYNHRDRSKESDYFARFKEIMSAFEPEILLRVLRFGRYSVRDYLFFIRPEHQKAICERIDGFMCNKNWSRLFSEVEL